MSKQLLSGQSSAIVQLTMREHGEQGTLAGVHIAEHRNSNLLEVVRLDLRAYQKECRVLLLGVLAICCI